MFPKPQMATAEAAQESVSWIQPNQKFEQQVIDLSIIDQVVVRCWSSYVLCFSNSDDHSNSQTFEYLKEGLQRTIEQFPFIAGSLVPKKDAKEGSLEIVLSPGSGVAFYHRDISRSSKLTFREMERNHFPPTMIESSELQIGPSVQEIESAPHNPVFLAQATFISGGVILFMAHSHQIADVTGTNSIMRTWAQNVTAAASGHDPVISDSLRQASLYSDRRRISRGDISDRSISINTFPMLVEDTPPPSPKHEPANVCGKLEQNVSVIWHFKSSQLEDLKSLASPKEHGTYISTLDAVNALYWRTVCRARHLAEKEVLETRMYFVCDVRRKLEPPLRSDSTCNATMKLFATQACGDIQQQDLATSLSKAAFSIRQAICSFSTSQFETWVSYVKSAPSFWSLKPKERLQSGPDIVVTDHSKVNVYQFEWGPLGSIKRIRNPWWARSTPKPYSQVTLMPRLPDGSLEVLTNFDDRTNAQLLADPELSRFAAVRCC